MKYLVTGTAGFIGYHTALSLFERGYEVIGIDNLDTYYDVDLKKQRLENLKQAVSKSNAAFHQYEIDISDTAAVNAVFEEHKPDRVINLAAQAGVRYSLENPMAYVKSNLVGFTNILEACRHNAVKHLTYASTSSVYGSNTSLPFSEDNSVDHPIQFYAATKRANELMAHSYSHLYQLPTTGLRFFTVYGPWGRPDMALFKFTKNILAGEPIDVFNHGKHARDFTYIDDIVEGVVRTSEYIPKKDDDWSSDNPNAATSKAPFRIFNIGNSKSVQLMDYIKAIEETTGKEAKINFLPLQPGDVPETEADTTYLRNAVDYQPNTSVDRGVKEFVAWYKSYYAET